MSDLETIADRVEIEALRGGCWGRRHDTGRAGT